MAIDIRRLSYALGAEISGVDLRRPVAPGTLAAIRAAWMEHCVLLFRGQYLTHEEHIAFSRNFGRLEEHPIGRHRDAAPFPQIFEVSNRIIDGKLSHTAYVAREWHSDQAYTLKPPTGSLFYCRALPSVGGDTCFANMYMAYDTLSAGMKDLVERLEIVNDIRKARQGFDPRDVARDYKDVPPVIHRLVRVHPESGRKALFFSPAVTTRIHGMTAEESEGILAFLYRHAAEPEHVYRHAWQRHDLLMWDNRCTLHSALQDYDRNELRHMCRTTIVGEPLGRPMDEYDSAAAAE